MALYERDGELAALRDVVGQGGLGVIEGGVGMGKTALLDAACRSAESSGREVLRARGSELEAEFAFGVVRQLFERRLLGAGIDERDELLAGPAAAARPLLWGRLDAVSPDDSSFSVLHGLYWLTVNLSMRRALVVAVDDVHWVDIPSLRWLAYLASRLEGPALSVLVALRLTEPTANEAPLLARRAGATTVARPSLLGPAAVAAVVKERIGVESGDELCVALERASGGNPLYLAELLRAVEAPELTSTAGRGDKVAALASERVSVHVARRIRRLDPAALRLAQALAVLGDGSELRHAAALAEVDNPTGLRLATGLVRLEVLASVEPPRFLHPIVREAVEASLGTDGRDAAHRRAAQLLDGDEAPPGRIAAHLVRVQPTGEPWVVSRLREAADAAMRSGTPRLAAELLGRALAEPPPVAARVAVLRELARADASAGHATACGWLEQALALTSNRSERAEIALEVAEVHAASFRWVDAVDLIERALEELGDENPDLAARLEAQLAVAGLHDARRASRVASVLRQLTHHHPTDAPPEALAVGQAMASVLAGRPAHEAATLLEAALASATSVESWDTRAALLWTLVTTERFETVETALQSVLGDVHRSGSARGLIVAYSTLGLLKLRLGALPEADAAARVALRVLLDGDFAPGLPFASTVLSDVAVEAGDLDQAEALLDLVPEKDWMAGIGTVLIPAARGRLRLAESRPAEALADFQICASMFSPAIWGIELRDVGYLHARSGAAQALLQLGRRDEACSVAMSELADVRQFGTPRALGVAARAAGLASGGSPGIELLAESVAALQRSPALLERAKSLVELGAALRRAGQRGAARDPLAEALDLAARCGARPLAARARVELHAAGARPRREWRRGVEALTPSERRIAELAAGGKTNREIAHTLYVTVKTVEGHLARAYGKLGIGGRGELRDALDPEKCRVGTP